MIGDGRQRLVAEVPQALGVLVEDLAGRRQLYRFARTIEQAVAIFLLQLANLGADRRLRAEDLLPGAGEAAMPGDLEECD